MNILIPMAGLGTRFFDAGYIKPKPLIKINGKTMLERVVINLYHPEARFIFVINTKQISEKEINKVVSPIIDKFSIIELDYTPKGPAASCLCAKDLITQNELIIVNCDQIIKDLEWHLFYRFVNTYNPTAIIGVFFSNNPKNSYIQLNEKGEIILVKEKLVISNMATNGFHYWQNGLDFIKSAEEMIKNNDSVKGEFYVSQTFNFLDSKAKTLPFYFNLHFPIGTPEDLELNCRHL